MDVTGRFTLQSMQSLAKDEGGELIHSKYGAIRALHHSAAGNTQLEGMH